MTEKRVHLREMTDKEYASFIFYSREHQAACLKKEKGISEEEAYVETEEELNKMLPNGKNTPGNYFMAICTRDDSVVGNMWYMHDTRREDTYLFLCDFHILQKERRKGYGKEALSEMEEVARQLSCKKCVLFVKNKNIGARMLYEKCGYIYRNERENGVYMDKDVLKVTFLEAESFKGVHAGYTLEEMTIPLSIFDSKRKG